MYTSSPITQVKLVNNHELIDHCEKKFERLPFKKWANVVNGTTSIFTPVQVQWESWVKDLR